jgi:ribosomal protein S18 acetylase RimI-like enzyme
VTITIRPAAQDEAPVVAALSIAGWRETYAGHIGAPYLAALDRHPKHDVASWQARVAATDRRHWTFIAALDEPVGFVHCRESAEVPGHRSEIWRLYILRRAQGRGIGRALMDVAARTLEANGLAPFGLWVLEFNAGARAFYERLGGAPVARQSFPLADATAFEVSYGWPTAASLARQGARA